MLDGLFDRKFHENYNTMVNWMGSFTKPSSGRFKGILTGSLTGTLMGNINWTFERKCNWSFTRKHKLEL